MIVDVGRCCGCGDSGTGTGSGTGSGVSTECCARQTPGTLFATFTDTSALPCPGYEQTVTLTGVNPWLGTMTSGGEDVNVALLCVFHDGAWTWLLSVDCVNGLTSTTYADPGFSCEPTDISFTSAAISTPCCITFGGTYNVHVVE